MVADPAYLLHDTGSGHPESAERLRALEPVFAELAADPRYELLREAPAAGEEQILTAHTAGHFRRVREACLAGPAILDAGDTPVVPASWPAALKSVGGVVEAARRVHDGRWRRAFCAVRPPGHHAEPSRALGFCLFNNLAVAANVLQEPGRRPPVAKVAIVDFDVHHGNGTQEIFWEDPTVFYASCHQQPLFPGTGGREERGAGMGLGMTLNRPLPPGAGDEAVVAWIEGECAEAVRCFRPDFLLVSAGFDGHVADPLAALRMTTEGYARVSRALVALAEELCDGRLVSTLEGGYELKALRESVAAHLEALALGVDAGRVAPAP
ncbi:MAG: histone deacetylase [Candidatus Krumholzibacteriota bacterium]|nr:histone deacetylase [Candidatus Krumholzibacteriota bacterium]